MLDKASLITLKKELTDRSIVDMSTMEIEQAYQTITQASDTAELRVAWLGNHTLDPIARSASVASLTYGLQISNYLGPYNQHFQEILNDHSELFDFNPNVIVFWLSVRGIYRELVDGGVGLSRAERSELTDRIFDHVQEWVAAAKQRSTATLFICNFPRPGVARLSLADMASSVGEAKLFAELNLRLIQLYYDDPQVVLVDADNAIATIGRRCGWNPALFYLAKIEWGDKAGNAVADLLARSFRALCRPARKCLIVDLDNTLWGGVVGEDGPDGIRVAEGDPVGECFQAFQRALLDLKARGVVLAICSKNNPADVEEAFRRRRDMPLKLADFVAQRVNWRHKHENILSIAQELNIGTTSLAFVDDSPAECALVQRMLPEVKTIQLPEDPANYVDLVLSLPDFDKLALTEEDRQKTEQYFASTARQAHRTSAKDLNSYLESLGTVVSFREGKSEDLTRLHQLFSKTNQFNTTTQRYNPSQIQTFIEDEAYFLELVEAKDRFGDLGVIGLYLLRCNDEMMEIDSLILSCRALGRGIETAMCNRIKQQAFNRLGALTLRARFIPTKKNLPCANFYDSEGFLLIEESDGAQRTFELPRYGSELRRCPGVNVEQGVGESNE